MDSGLKGDWGLGELEKKAYRHKGSWWSASSMGLYTFSSR
ncbi:hypothetical protein ACP70R_018151 [Stipagrostis hirtigluma subsp. patula]